MTLTYRSSVVVALMLVCGLVLAQKPTTKPATEIGVGSAAPALKTGRWIKGEPVKALEAGTVYVVEFWATWCPPCRTTIPELTKMQKEFPDAVFIGQDVFERDQTAPEPFVEKMGDQMNYRVAMDTPDNNMAKTWMMAAGQNGIPCAFVVGKDGKIAWIGHPMAGLDKAVKQALAASAPQTPAP